MFRNLLTIIILSICSVSNAQINEIGVTVGASNFIGDIGATNYISPKDLGYGIQYRWNRSPRHSWRASYNYLKLSGDDAKSDMMMRKTRNLSFKNNIHELSVGIEFNFFEFDLHNEWFSFTPYLYTGVTGLKYDETYFDKKKQQKTEDAYSLAIPLSAGFKAQINKRIVLSTEIGLRYTFTDNLDGNNPSSNKYAGSRFGNTNSNDWYVFTGLTLSYTFGKNPCYCAPN